jgi:hypothetical protein
MSRDTLPFALERSVGLPSSSVELRNSLRSCELRVLLVAHLEIELQSELHVTRIDSASDSSEIAGPNG